MGITYNKLLKLIDENGLTSYKVKKLNLIGQATLTAIKRGGDIDTRSIAKLCAYFNCQPGDLLEYVPENEPIEEEAENE